MASSSNRLPTETRKRMLAFILEQLQASPAMRKGHRKRKEEVLPQGEGDSNSSLRSRRFNVRLSEQGERSSTDPEINAMFDGDGVDASVAALEAEDNPNAPSPGWRGRLACGGSANEEATDPSINEMFEGAGEGSNAPTQLPCNVDNPVNAAEFGPVVDVDSSGRDGEGLPLHLPSATLAVPQQLQCDGALRGEENLVTLPPNWSVRRRSSLSDPAVLAQLRDFIIQVGEGDDVSATSALYHLMMSMLAICRFEQSWASDRLQLSSLAEEVRKLKAENSEYEKRCAELRVVENQLNAATQEAELLNDELARTRSDLIVVATLYDEAQRQLQAAKQSHADTRVRLEGEIKAARGELSSLEGEIEGLQNELLCLNAKYNAAEGSLSAAKEEHARAKAEWEEGTAVLEERLKKDMQETVGRICGEKEKELQEAVARAASEAVLAYKSSEQYLKDLSEITGELIVEHMRESRAEINSVVPGVPWDRIPCYKALLDLEKNEGPSESITDTDGGTQPTQQGSGDAG